MTKRNLVFVAPLLLAAICCYALGYIRGERAQKTADEVHNIRIALKNLQDAESDNSAAVAKRCRMYLLGYTRTYRSLVKSNDVPDSFKATLIEAERVATEVEKDLAPLTKETLEK